jgi:hypothetical protein
LQVSEVSKVLIKLTPKDYATGLTFPQSIKTEQAAGAHDQLNTIYFISDAKKQTLKTLG